MSSSDATAPRVALVYDHLITDKGGAENVLQALLGAFPDAPLFTTIFDAAEVSWIDPQRVRAVQLPKILDSVLHNRELLAVFAPILLEQHDFSQYDLIISVTTAAAKGVLTAPEQLHVSYVLSPPRYIYHQSDELLSTHKLLRLPVLRSSARAVLQYISWWDKAAAHRPDVVFTLSEQVARRIQQLYDRAVTEVIAPPVTLQTQPETTKKLPPFLLSLGRLVAYKRVDLVVAAALETTQLLVVAGTGRELQALQKQAGSKGVTRTTETLEAVLSYARETQKNIVFLRSVSEAEKATLLSSAEAVIAPGIEDFGITLLEAVCSGTPVVLHLQSGAAEQLQESEYISISEQTVPAVVAALKTIKTKQISPTRQLTLQKKLSEEAFIRKLHNLVFPLWKSHARMATNRKDT